MIKQRDEKIRQVAGDHGSLLKNHVGVIMENNRKDRKIQDMAKKLLEKDATIMALKENINLKKLVFFTISFYFLWNTPFPVKVF